MLNKLKKKKESTNIIEFKKTFEFNIGRIIYAVLFVYLIIIVVSYALRSHIAVCEVQLGTLASNNTYRALAVRDETVVRATQDGYVTYFAKEGTKISSKSLVYAVSPQENYYEGLQGEFAENASGYSNQEIKDLEIFMDDFYYTYDEDAFFHSYTFLNSLNANLLNAMITTDGQDTFQEGMNVNYGGIPGVVVYNVDGLETVTVDNFTDEEVHALSYSSTNLALNKKVSPETPVYKVVTDEDWSLVIEVDDSVIRLLEGEEYVKIRFTDDDVTCYATVTSQVKNDKYYLILGLSSHMIRYANQRYVDIELITETANGYKIPTSCVTTEQFIKVPVDYVTQGGNSSQSGLLKQEKNEDGKLVNVFYNVDFYKEENGYYYIFSEDFKLGDKIVIPNTGEVYVLNESEELEGVYCVNIGYAVFRLIDVIYQNEDYCIIKTNTSHGLSNYDHIALEGDEIENGQMIN